MKVQTFFLSFFTFFLASHLAFGGIARVQGKWSDERYVPQLSVHEHYDEGCKALFEEKYDIGLYHFLVIVYHFYDTPFYADALFYSGECYFHSKEYDLADKQFSLYLGLASQTRHFEKVFEYKYFIAEAYRKGALRHLLGMSKLPKLNPSKEVALELYEEIIAALPGHEISANALYGKSKLLNKQKKYPESIESLKTLTRRFPRHPLGAKGFVMISKIYLNQSLLQSQNPDYIALAELNLEKMQQQFPGDPKIELLQNNIFCMKEIYAKSLFETGRFYERKRKPHAAAIYYTDAINHYPNTHVIEECKKRLEGICKNIEKCQL